MSDVRALLADAILEHRSMGHWQECRKCGWAQAGSYEEHLADVLLALPGVAIVELPEGATYPSGSRSWPAECDSVFLDHEGISAVVCESDSGEAQLVNPRNPRALAAALLAAAKATEGSDG